jgi:hypothetical protein
LCSCTRLKKHHPNAYKDSVITVPVLNTVAERRPGRLKPTAEIEKVMLRKGINEDWTWLQCVKCGRVNGYWPRGFEVDLEEMV